jgi:hypothetical protein
MQNTKRDQINQNNLPEAFANHLKNKVNSIFDEVTLDK